jgi:hypothetical protein
MRRDLTEPLGNLSIFNNQSDMGSFMYGKLIQTLLRAIKISQLSNPQEVMSNLKVQEHGEPIRCFDSILQQLAKCKEGSVASDMQLETKGIRVFAMRTVNDCHKPVLLVPQAHKSHNPHVRSGEHDL